MKVCAEAVWDFQSAPIPLNSVVDSVCVSELMILSVGNHCDVVAFGSGGGLVRVCVGSLLGVFREIMSSCFIMFHVTDNEACWFRVFRVCLCIPFYIRYTL